MYCTTCLLYTSAQSGIGGACIGGGNGGASGTIIISGGIVTVDSSLAGSGRMGIAGIGGGYDGPGGGTFLISGGEVTAKGASFAAVSYTHLDVYQRQAIF